MPRVPVPPIEPLRVTQVTLAEGAGKRIGLLGDRDQMNVIGHQAIAEQRDAMTMRAFVEGLEIETPVVVEQEDVLAVVAPLRDVMRRARRRHPGHTSHRVVGGIPMVSEFGSCPRSAPKSRAASVKTGVRELSPISP